MPDGPRNGPFGAGSARSGQSLGNDVANVERLVEGGEPFGARGGATAPALVDRKPQRVEQTADLLLGGHVRLVRLHPEGRLVEVVEGGEPARKEFAIDHALGEAVGHPEAEPQAELAEAFADRPLV